MDIQFLWILIGAVLMIVGFIGCFLPILPGPPISYVGLLFLQLLDKKPFDSKFLMTWAVITVFVTLLDYVIPIYGTKKFGGSKRGVWGSTLGLIAGIFFPPIGIIVGPLVGAFLGELSAGKQGNEAFKSALGSFFGFLAGTMIKLIAAGFMAYYFFINAYHFLVG